MFATRSSSSSATFFSGMKSSLTIPRTPCRAPSSSLMCPACLAACTTPTSDWLMTDVGPPLWPMTALPGVMPAMSMLLGFGWEKRAGIMRQPARDGKPAPGRAARDPSPNGRRRVDLS